MIRIKSESVESIRNGVASVDAELWVSSSADLPAADGIAGRQLVPGSIAIVQSESRIYTLGFDNEWKEWGAEQTEPDSTSASPALSPLPIDRSALQSGAVLGADDTADVDAEPTELYEDEGEADSDDVNTDESPAEPSEQIVEEEAESAAETVETAEEADEPTETTEPTEDESAGESDAEDVGSSEGE